ncbi:MAG TPA: four helix bundle protein [Verrucomicrobiae bacterium]|nr:four helix bundle protein [Verrucomicrobiae bacterium]
MTKLGKCDYKSNVQINSAKELVVYERAYQLSMKIFHLTKSFPIEERFGLTGQIRRSSRSVCQNLREAWAKRRYGSHFVSKLTDCDGENAETDTCLDLARDCAYLTAKQHAELASDCTQIGRMLGAMINNPGPFLLSH